MSDFTFNPDWRYKELHQSANSHVEAKGARFESFYAVLLVSG